MPYRPSIKVIHVYKLLLYDMVRACLISSAEIDMPAPLICREEKYLVQHEERARKAFGACWSEQRR